MEQVSAKIIADSISPEGIRMTTMEIEFPRIILAELNTHRLLGKNSASSRAIPIKKVIEQTQTKPAMPARFGKANKGMQDAGEHNELIDAGYTAEEWWKLAALSAGKFAEGYAEAGYAKQVANRLLEPFQRMKTVISGTDWQNLFWLRVDKDADPTFYALAKMMQEAYNESIPEELKSGEWHTPYVDHKRSTQGNLTYWTHEEGSKEITLEEAKAISASCCAQVSYRALDTSLEKGLSIYEKLIGSGKPHASPFEHCATPMERPDFQSHLEYIVTMSTKCTTQGSFEWENGSTALGRDKIFRSGNLRGWTQLRQLIPNNVKAN